MFIRHNFERIKSSQVFRRIRHGVPKDELRSPFEPATLPIYGLMAFVAVSLVTAFFFTSFEIDFKGLGSPIATFASLILSSFALRRFGHDRIAGASEAVGILGLSSLLIAFSLTILCATNQPLTDEILIKADAFIGFSWIDLIQHLQGRTTLNDALVRIYKSIRWQPFLLICIMMIHTQHRILWIFILSWMMGLIMTAALFPFFPAVAAINYYGVSIDPTAHAANFVDWMQGLRNGSIRLVDHSSIKGIVTFPSFHATAAIYFAWGFWKFPWLRFPFLALNIAMIFATIVIGGHYFVDILAGGLIAVLSIAASTRFVKRRIFIDQTANVSKSPA